MLMVGRIEQKILGWACKGDILTLATTEKKCEHYCRHHFVFVRVLPGSVICL